MLSKKEIINISKIRGIKPYQQEKHYIQTLILNILSDYPLVFKGGTYLWFFYNLNRFSTDLDFTIDFTNLPIIYKNIKSFSNHINKKINDMLWILDGVKSQSKIININDFGFSIKVLAEGPLYTTKKSVCFVDIDVSFREKILLPTTSFSLDFPAYNLPIKIINGMNIKEIFAEKIRAIYTRKKARDMYDIWFLINKKDIYLTKEIIEVVNKKLETSGSSEKIKFNINDFKKRLLKLKNIFSKDMLEIKFQDINNFNFYYSSIIDNIFGK